MKLKLKIPKTVTDRQKQLIEEFDNPDAPTSTQSSDKTSEAKSCNSTFTIEQAWRRVKDYWSSTGKKASGDSGSSDDAKEKATKEAKASA